MDFALELQTISLVGENYFFNYYIFTQVRSWAHENNFEKDVKSYYSLPIMLFALLFLYWEEYNAPIIHLFQNELPIFNEESGEIVFNILAKTISSISEHGFRKLSQFYTMINCYRASQSAFSGDISLSSDDFYIQVSKDSAEVKNAISTIKTLLFNLKSNYENSTPIENPIHPNWSWLFSDNNVSIEIIRRFKKVQKHALLPLNITQ